MYADKTSSDLARQEFSERLLQSLDRIGFSDSQTRLAEAFNHRSGGDTVSVHGARKWLTGGSIPTQARLVVLAKWLGVDAAWLRFGDGATAPPESSTPNGVLGNLHSDLDLLSESEATIVRGLVDALFKVRKLKA